MLFRKRIGFGMALFVCFVLVLFVFVMAESWNAYSKESKKKEKKQEPVADGKLSAPLLKGKMSLEETIKNRRSRREYEAGKLTEKQLSQLLWSAYGITENKTFENRNGEKIVIGFHSVPSAGATFPMDIYAVIGEDCVEGMKAGVYHYVPAGHKLDPVKDGDVRAELQKACWGQRMVNAAQVSIIITAEYERVTGRYKDRGIRFAIMESGCIAQNIHLQCEALNLSTVIIGAFGDDKELQKAVGLPEKHEPLIVMPVGLRKKEEKHKQ